MVVPEPPTLTQLERITPSIYEASIRCLAKAAWYAVGARGLLPDHPGAMMGTTFHATIASAHRGELSHASEIQPAETARNFFDSTAQALHQLAHPLTRLKFPRPDRVPYYNLVRERAALLASRIAPSRTADSGSPGNRKGPPPIPAVRTESYLCSRDRLITGRPDHIDGMAQTVIDYKSGYVADDRADIVSDAEARQLRLYAYLAQENQIPVSKGIIVRAGGQQCGLAISSPDAAMEADRAKGRLRNLNSSIQAGASFGELTSPSQENCRMCPCIPFCAAFWKAAKDEWQAECGLHVEGEVAHVEACVTQGLSLTTLALNLTHGSLSTQQASIEQVPTSWLTVQGNRLPQVGDNVRVVHCRESSSNDGRAVIRVDRTLTAVWRLPTAV